MLADERRGHASGVVGEHLVLLGRRVARGGVLEDEGEEGGGVTRGAAAAVDRERLQEAGLEIVRSGVLGVLGLAQRVGEVAAGRGHEGAVARRADCVVRRMGHHIVRCRSCGASGGGSRPSRGVSLSARGRWQLQPYIPNPQSFVCPSPSPAQ